MLNYVGVATPTPADITAAATHILNFIDMGGHEKYLKTTLYGMTCLLPGVCGGGLCGHQWLFAPVRASCLDWLLQQHMQCC